MNKSISSKLKSLADVIPGWGMRISISIIVLILMLGCSSALADTEEIVCIVEYDKDEVNVGETLTASFTISGGSGEYESVGVGWYLHADGGTGSSEIAYGSFDGRNSGTFSCTPEASGEVRFVIVVTDSVGRSSSEVCEYVKVSGIMISGDIDKNGSVDLADGVILLQQIAQKVSADSEGANISNADVNMDERVDVHDVLRILQYSAGWAVKLK